MNDFLERMKTDKKAKAGVKLAMYSIFVLIVAIYALTAERDTSKIETIIAENNKEKTVEKNTEIIQIPDNYNYMINITIDEKEYKYTGQVNNNEKTIIKTIDDNSTEYLYRDHEYYIKEEEHYIKVNKDEVYDIINYNYIDLATINTYLNKAIVSDNQYLVYLKDIILGNDSDKYFTITVNDNNIDIDYTPLMKTFNNNIVDYKVSINIERI